MSRRGGHRGGFIAAALGGCVISAARRLRRYARHTGLFAAHTRESRWDYDNQG